MISVSKLSVSAYVELESFCKDSIDTICHSGDVLQDAIIEPKTKTVLISFRVKLDKDSLLEDVNAEIDALCR